MLTKRWKETQLPAFQALETSDLCCSNIISLVVVCPLLQVARKLVIIESDLERAEERAELSER